MAPGLRITDYRLSENEAFSLVKWNGPVIILVLVNRSTSGEDMREKRFSHFCSRWPRPFTSRLRICSSG